MKRSDKNEIYDKICIALTDYENSENTEEINAGFLDEFYSLLVVIQNRWEELTGDDESYEEEST